MLILSLLSAADLGNVEIFKYIIDAGVPYYVTDGSGYSALHHAAKQGHAGIIHYFITRTFR